MTNAVTRAILEARAIGRRHPDDATWLLHNRSIRIEPGERVAVVGEVGSGKTLLLRALALLDPIDTGEIYWLGQPIANECVPLYRSQVVYLHQRSAFETGSVEENLVQPFELHVHRDKTYDRNVILRYLDAVGRDQTLLTRSTGDLSGGERQIVALMRAMQLSPSVLLLDEPTASMDAGSASMVERLVRTWLDEQADRAFVWVSHDAEQVRRVADRVVTLT